MIILIYAGLIAVCLGIVWLIGELNQPGGHGSGTSAETESTRELTEPEETEESQKETEKETDSSSARETEAESYYLPDRQEGEDGRENESWQEESQTEPKPYRPPTIAIASDIHYYPPELTDYGKAFEAMTGRDDGKLVRYIPQLMDTFGDEMEALAPDAVILSGDLTLNGEKMAHEALAEKLRSVTERGIRVLVIPGNHDINNRNAASYFGEEREAVPGIDAEEFLEIYHEFGYDQALSRDEFSLSYVYGLDEKNWLMMLDSAQYEPVNLVGGRIKSETLEWMRQQFKLAGEMGIHVTPVAHHNLLQESRLYPQDCTLENSREVIELLEEYRISVYISGHLHLQRTKKYKPEPGEPEDSYHISEIVADSFAIPPCQYGILKWGEDGSVRYGTREADVESWAAKNGVEDENLLNFREYGTQSLVDVIGSQIYKKMSSLPEEHMRKMAEIYGELNRAYCAGVPVDEKEVRSEEGFRLWERNLPDSQMFEEMEDILRDTKKDHNSWEYKVWKPEE